jgi:hypothetical protein
MPEPARARDLRANTLLARGRISVQGKGRCGEYGNRGCDEHDGKQRLHAYSPHSPARPDPDWTHRAAPHRPGRMLTRYERSGKIRLHIAA